MVKISPSLLSADFTILEKEIQEVEAAGAEYLHLDVMDGIFVPNISFGPPVIKSIRKVTDMVFDVHLMITKPGRFIKAFADAGSDIITLHLEADEPQNIRTAIDQVKALGKKVGLSLKPKTPAETLLPYIKDLDLVLIMTVEPGFGGQAFMPDQLDKIRTVRTMIDAENPSCELEVDGGIDPDTKDLVIDAGATVLVAGSAIFGKTDRAAAIQTLRG